MAFQVSPGVNVSEIDLTTVVPAVSTTEGAIAAHLKWGPVEELVLVDSEDRLVNVFNKPNANTAVDFFTAANFLTYASALWVSRAVDSTAKNAASGAAGGFRHPGFGTHGAGSGGSQLFGGRWLGSCLLPLRHDASDLAPTRSLTL